MLSGADCVQCPQQADPQVVAHPRRGRANEAPGFGEPAGKPQLSRPQRLRPEPGDRPGRRPGVHRPAGDELDDGLGAVLSGAGPALRGLQRLGEDPSGAAPVRAQAPHLRLDPSGAEQGGRDGTRLLPEPGKRQIAPVETADAQPPLRHLEAVDDPARGGELSGEDRLICLGQDRKELRRQPGGVRLHRGTADFPGDLVAVQASRGQLPQLACARPERAGPQPTAGPVQQGSHHQEAIAGRPGLASEFQCLQQGALTAPGIGAGAVNPRLKRFAERVGRTVREA